MLTRKKRAFLGLFLVLLTTQLTPQTVMAAETCSLTLADSVAGLGTQGSLEGCASTQGILAIERPDGTTFTQAIGRDGSIVIPGRLLEVAGRYVATAGASSTTFTVLADKPESAHTALTTEKAASDRFKATAHLTDRYDNPIAGRPLALLSSDATDDISASDRETDDAGRFSWMVEAGGAPERLLSVYDLFSGRALTTLTVRADGVPGARSGLRADITSMGGETFGALDHFEIKVNSTTIPVNQQFTLSIVALDSNDNVVEDFTENVILSSDDPEAEFPKNGIITFRPVDLGERVLPLGSRFLTTGTKTIRVRSQDNPAIEGSLTVEVTRSGSQGDTSIQILDPKDGTATNKPTILLQGKAPSFVNLQVIGAEGTGASDGEGVYRINVTLPVNDVTAQTRYALIVTSENNQYSSAPLNIVYDPTPPTIDAITFDPPEGKTETPSTIMVSARDESGIESVVATIGTQTITLNETASGSFRAEFTAPAVRTYDVAVKATDRAGNETTMLSKWTVGVKGVPKIEGLTAAGEANAILLSWQALPPEADVKTYKIYIAEEPGNYVYTREVDSSVTSVKIADVTPGKPYEFTVTGKNFDGEEGEKADPVRSASLGMIVRAEPGNGILRLEWTPPAGMQIGNYILELGTSPGQYTAKSILNGGLESYTIPDLLNDIAYEVKLTPVWVTGKTAHEMSAIVHGTPSGSGFHPGPSDPIPSDEFPVEPIDDETPAIEEHPPTHNSATGLPSMIAWTALALAVLLAALVREHKARKKLASAFVLMMDRQYGNSNSEIRNPKEIRHSNFTI